MTKKNLLVAIALPLAFAACSSEDVLTESQELQQGQYNVEKVNAVFGTDGAESRLATGWMENLEAGKDMLGLAWLGDGENVEINGKAFQNHPLYTQANGNLKPETSIYVGEYFSYYPYDAKTVSVANVNFSVANQPLTTVYNDIAKNSIWVSPKWTTVTSTGVDADGEAGIEKPTAIYPRLLTNRVRLALDFVNHNIAQGNTSINYIQVGYLHNNEPKSVVSFKYSPLTPDATGETLAQDFWATKTINDVQKAGEATTGYIKLQSEPYEVLADAEGVGFFYNALPMTERPSVSTDIFVMLNTTYGNIYIQKPFNTVAYTRGEEGYDVYPDAVAPFGECKSFVYKLNKLGKFEIEVNFLTALMNGMCVENDAHLNKLLNYYAQYKKGTIYDEYNSTTETGIVLKLEVGEFELSKENIALLREINAEKDLILLDWCEGHSRAVANKLVVTGGEEVPELSHVFVNPTEVYLSEEEWTWNDDEAKEMGNVPSITNEGVLNFDAGIVEVEEEEFALNNAGTMNLTGKTNFLLDVNNNRVINIAKEAQFRIAGATLINDVTAVTGVRTGVWGEIYNEGRLMLIEQTGAEIHNYGYIKHSEGAYTLISHNQSLGASINDGFNIANNKLGIIEVNSDKDNEQITVYKSGYKGLIVATWIPTADNKYVKPENCVYNYLIVKDNIEFTTLEMPAVIEFKGQNLEYTSNSIMYDEEFPTCPKSVECVIVDAGSDVTIMKGSSMRLECAYVKGDIYNAGEYQNSGQWKKLSKKVNNQTINYYGWSPNLENPDYVIYFGGHERDNLNVGTSVNN